MRVRILLSVILLIFGQTLANFKELGVIDEPGFSFGLNGSYNVLNLQSWSNTAPVKVSEEMLLRSFIAERLRNRNNRFGGNDIYGSDYGEHEDVHSGMRKANKPPEEYIHFVLYRGGNIMEDGTNVRINDTAALQRSGFRPDFPTKIIIHGYNSDYLNGPGETLLPEYFNSNRYNKAINVVLVNWSNLAGYKDTNPEDLSPKGLMEMFYYRPARNTVLVGKRLGDFIKFLVRDGGTNPSLIHIIGFSLGAHTAGNAGMATQPEFKVGRITALDPAGPCFETVKYLCPKFPYRTVSRDDAEFVDSIHTCGSLLGMKNSVGHVDFFPNGGLSQPGCSWWALDFGQCSHVRAVDLMTESVKRAGTGRDIFAKKCDSWDAFDGGKCARNPKIIMGEGCDPDSRGRYMIKTLGEAPFIRYWNGR